MSESKTPRTEQYCETPVEDLCKAALAHYEEISAKACHWHNQIPQAIEFWYLQKPKLEAELSVALQTIKQVADNIAGAPDNIVEWSAKVGNAIQQLDAALQREKELELKLDISETNFIGAREALIREGKRAERAEAELSRYREAEKALPEEPICPKLEQGKFSCDEYAALVDYIDALRAHAAALQAKGDAVREDAERYRWLRGDTTDYSVLCEQGLCGEVMDSAIDAARKETL